MGLKKVFDELIESGSFDNIFKNSIRDYYTYGFKSYDQNINSQKTVSNRWKIFSKILNEKWEFQKERNGRNRIVLKTMPSGADNPVDDLYFFHNLSKMGDYLNYLIDLDPRSVWNHGKHGLPVSEDVLKSDGSKKLEDTNEVEYAIIDNWMNVLQGDRDVAYDTDTSVLSHVRINRQLNIWSSQTRPVPGSDKDDDTDKYANLGNRTGYLYALGVIGDLRDDGNERKNWLKKQWETYSRGSENSADSKKFNSDTSEKGNHYWFKSPVTMAFICGQQMEDKNDAERSPFINRFTLMCKFFSQYYPLGEVGAILAQRCKNNEGALSQNIFSFKHNYIQKSLYDYNLIDLLVAIEKGFLCLLKYTHGTSLKSSEEIAIPLEIRISVTNGREYVLYYQILERKIKALRLEFIDKITMYSDVSSLSKVKRSITKEGKKLDVQKKEVSDIGIDKKELVGQVMTAKEMLQYIWGTDVGECIVDDSWKNRLIPFDLPISFEKDSEKYIETRFKRENRFGDKDGKITIFPTKELRTWIRSYYVRVTKPKINDILDISDDVNDMWNVYFGKEILAGNEGDEYKKNKEKTYTEYGYSLKGTIVPAEEGHGSLFNELFSWYSIILANSIFSFSVDQPHDLKRKLNDLLEDALGYFTSEEKEQVIEELNRYISDSELVNETGELRFKMPELDYLYDFLPLTKIEVRWLLTVLDDSLSKVFLSENEIQHIRDALSMAPFKTEKINLDAINYFDRYNIEERFMQGKKHIVQKGRMTDKDISHIKKIYSAIEHKHKICVRFRIWNGDKRKTTCAPVRIEYSCRDDVFRVWYVQREKKQIRKINVPRIICVEELDGQDYDLEDETKLLDKLFNETMTDIKVEFYQGKKNLPDRILTEFSLWKKECVYDTSTKRYTMTLHYSTLDEKEIMIRLLSYGPYIKIVADGDNNFVLVQIKKRILEQRDLIQTREFEDEYEH